MARTGQCSKDVVVTSQSCPSPPARTMSFRNFRKERQQDSQQPWLLPALLHEKQPAGVPRSCTSIVTESLLTLHSSISFLVTVAKLCKPLLVQDSSPPCMSGMFEPSPQANARPSTLSARSPWPSMVKET